MLNAPRRHGSHGEKFLRSWRGLIGLLFSAKLVGKFNFTQTELVGLSVGDLDRSLISDCWQFVRDRRKGAVRPSNVFVKEVCGEFAQQHTLNGLDSVGRRAITAFYANWRSDVGVTKVSPAFINQVDFILPPQPWPQGTHLEVAEKLGVAPKLVTSAIRQLIDGGRRYEQIDGVLFDSFGNAMKPKST